MVIKLQGNSHFYIKNEHSPSEGEYWFTLIGGTGEEYGRGVDTDSAGNIYMSGQTSSSGGAGNFDALIIKLAPNGNQIWQRSIGGTNYEDSYDIVVDKNNNCLYIVGRVESAIVNTEADYLLVKYDLDGTLLWQRSIGEDFYEDGQDITVDSSGNIYIIGYSDSTSEIGEWNTFIIKFNSSGVVQWQKKYGASFITDPDTAYDDTGHSIFIDSTGNIYVTGLTSSLNPEGLKIFITKFDSNCDIIWQKRLLGVDDAQSYSVKVDNVGNIFVLGHTRDNAEGLNDIILTKLNSAGAIQWQRILGGSGNEEGYDLVLDSFNNTYIVGLSNSSGSVGGNDILIAKYNAFGVLKWQKLLGGVANDYGYGIALDKNGDIIITGRSFSLGGAGSSDAIVAKLPADGSVTGIWSGWELKNATLVDKKGSLLSENINYIISNSSFVDQSSSLTNQSRSLTLNKIDLI